MVTSDWSLPLGTWLGCRWRVSWLVPTVCLIILTNGHWRQPTPADSDLSILGPLVVSVYLFSLFAREIVDALLARSTGTEKGDVCIGPLGNITPRRPSPDPRKDLFLATFGPLSHLVLGLVGIAICLAYDQRPRWSWLNPITPPPVEGKWEWVQVGMALWVTNWSLALLRLLPAQPLEGHSILLSLVRMARPGLSTLWASLIVRHLCLLIGALSLGFSLGAFLWGPNPGLIPDWLIPACIAVFLVWGAVSRLSTFDYSDDPATEQSLQGKPFVQFSNISSPSLKHPEMLGELRGVDSLTSSGEETYSFDSQEEFWSEGEWEPIENTPREPAFPDSQTIDSVLEKLHTEGKDSLTQADRDILDKASEYLRKKLGNSDRT